MDIALWVLAGAAIGWIGFSLLKANEKRGMTASVVIGIVGGFLGGKVLAPVLGTIPVLPGNFSPFALVVALATAAACLTIGNLVLHRYGI